MSNNVIDNILSSLSTGKLKIFVRMYALSDAVFLKALEEYVESTHDKPFTFDYKKEVANCYTHYFKSPRWEHEWRDYPQFLDWDNVSTDLKKVIKKANYAIDAGYPELAVETAFLIIETNERMYEEDFLCEREDWSAEDLCLDDCFELIEKSMKSPLMTKDQKLEICERAQKFYRFEVVDYIEYDFEQLIEDTRASLMTEDEILEIKIKEFKAEQGWRVGSMACDIWDYLFEIGRPDKAESFFLENPAVDELRVKFVEYKIGLGYLDEAMDAINEGISLAKKQSLFGLVRQWKERKLQLYEIKGDKRAPALCLELFADSNTGSALDFYNRAKILVTPEKWPDFRDKLLSSNKNFLYSADSVLADIYCEEGMLDALYSHLLNAKNNLLPALSKYVKYFSKEQQENLINALKREFPISLGYNPNRKAYNHLAWRLNNVARLCPAGKKLAREIVEGFRHKYPNRPALIEELAKITLK